MTKVISLKAFFITIVVVLIAGLLYSVVIKRLTSSNSKPNINSLSNIAPAIQGPVSFDLEITSPEDETLVFEDSISISGKTSPKSWVIISNQNDDSEVDSDLRGNFSKVIQLNSGLNYIYITAFDSQGNSKQVKKTVYFSESQI